MKHFLAIAVFAPLMFAVGPASAATAARNYDCSKPGNASKAVCKGKTTPAKAAPTPATIATTRKTTVRPATTRNYDCSKAGNANKAVCKSAAPAPKVTVAPAPRAATTPSRAAPTIASRSAVPAGAAAGKCRDGTETHATNHRGACSHHGGVAAWY